MLFLITIFQQEDLTKEQYALEASRFNEKLQETGCQLLTHSDKWDIFAYRVEDKHEEKIRELCKNFALYSKQVFQAELLFDLFTSDEVADSELFSKEFIEAIKAAEG